MREKVSKMDGIGAEALLYRLSLLYRSKAKEMELNILSFRTALVIMTKIAEIKTVLPEHEKVGYAVYIGWRKKKALKV